MKSELLSADISAKETPLTTVSAQLLARGSGARPGYYLWCMRQRGSSVDIRTESGWTQVINDGAVHKQNIVSAATATATPLSFPDTAPAAAEQAIDCMHAIRANPGSRDGCTSNTLELPASGDFDWQDISPDAMALPSQSRVEQLVPCGDKLYALAQLTDSGSPYEQCIFVAPRRAQPQWQEIVPPPVFAAGNSISHLISFCDTLYAAVDDDVGGFQLWHLDKASDWIRIVDRGGQEHSASARVNRRLFGQ